MAKKGNRIEFSLACVNCKRENYRTEKNKINTTDRLVLQKFCSQCRKVTEHKEAKN